MTKLPVPNTRYKQFGDFGLKEKLVLYLEDLANPKDNADLIPNFL